MFTYEGYGLVVPIADCGVETFLGAVNQVYGIGATNMEIFDDSMAMGTYESPDNIYSAQISGYDIDYSQGIVIVELPPAVYGSEVFTNVKAVMDLLGFDGWENNDEFVGDYLIECIN